MKYKSRVVFEGYAIDDILVYEETNKSRQKNEIKESNEFERFINARNTAVKNFDELYQNTLKRLGEDKAMLFRTYQLMAEDLDLEDLVRSYIDEKQVAEDAIMNACNQLAQSFSALDDEYMRQRAIDVIEVGKSIVSVLTGNNQIINITKPTILICSDLAASMLMRIDPKYLKALVLLKGNENSHVSIFARTLELPTLCAVDSSLILSSKLNGHKAIVDAVKGEIIIDPSFDELSTYEEYKKQYEEEKKKLATFIGKKSVTKDGVKLKLYANIALAIEIANIVKNDAEGIGLFRSEFVYLSSKNYPSEDFQFNYYREIIEEIKEKEVIIRTFDIGADKKVSYFNLAEEENPALGLRSIRICKQRPEILYTQLRALYRASVYGNLAIMIPMITSVEEVEFVNDLIKKVKNDLTKDGIKFNDKVKVGIMIETPAAALISDELAKRVDFFSIGTNDLSQYTLACDRLNPALVDTFNSKHPAIMRLVKLTVDNAHKAGITCSMCGELARDPEVLPFLAAIHIDELSCSSAYILKMRKQLSTIDTKKVDINKYLNYK